VLACARRIRAARVSAWTRARELERDARLFEPTPSTDEPRIEAAIEDDDLAAALVVCAPDTVADILPRGRSDALDRARARLDGFARAGEPSEPGRIAPSFGRRWGWNERIRGEIAATPSAVACALDERGLDRLAKLDPGYLAGEYVLGEVVNRLFSRLQAPFEKTPVPYVERAGELAALDAAFPRAGGAFLVGDEGTGRGMLAGTWLARARVGDVPPHLHALWGERHVRFAESTFGSIPLAPPPAGRIAARAVYDLGEERRERDASRVRQETSSRWLVLVTPGQLEASKRAYDPRDVFATISLPAITDADRIATWVCASAEMSDADLGHILEVFRYAGRGALELPDDPWIPWLRTGGTARGWFSTPRGPREFAPRAWIRRAVAAGRIDRLDSPHCAGLARYVPGGDLGDLLELERFVRS
jgi:hypothetical protein